MHLTLLILAGLGAFWTILVFTVFSLYFYQTRRDKKLGGTHECLDNASTAEPPVKSWNKMPRGDSFSKNAPTARAPESTPSSTRGDEYLNALLDPLNPNDSAG